MRKVEECKQPAHWWAKYEGISNRPKPCCDHCARLLGAYGGGKLTAFKVVGVCPPELKCWWLRTVEEFSTEVGSGHGAALREASV